MSLFHALILTHLRVLFWYNPPMKIIYKEVRQGTKFLIRYPKKNDGMQMHKYINNLSKEKTFIYLQGENISLKKEKEYLKEELKRIKNKQTVYLVCEINSEIIGAANIDLEEGASSHVGVLGISILNGYRNYGIGKKLQELIINEARINLPNLKFITLTVFEDNIVAINFYKKFGFKEFGKLPKAIFHNGIYKDQIYLYKNIKKFISSY
jgi:RimJ/RimL family protein N-acetyltransferase